MAAFVAKQMVGNKLNAVKGESMRAFFGIAFKIQPRFSFVELDFSALRLRHFVHFQSKKTPSSGLLQYSRLEKLSLFVRTEPKALLLCG